MDERKNNMFKQNKKREKQKKTHESELENISKYIKEVFLPLHVFVNNVCTCAFFYVLDM